MANPGIRDAGGLRMPAVRYPGGGAVGEWARGSFTTFEVGGVAVAPAFISVTTNFYRWRARVNEDEIVRCMEAVQERALVEERRRSTLAAAQQSAELG